MRPRKTRENQDTVKGAPRFQRRAEYAHDAPAPPPICFRTLRCDRHEGNPRHARSAAARKRRTRKKEEPSVRERQCAHFGDRFPRRNKSGTGRYCPPWRTPVQSKNEPVQEIFPGTNSTCDIYALRVKNVCRFRYCLTGKICFPRARGCAAGSEGSRGTDGVRDRRTSVSAAR